VAGLVLAAGRGSRLSPLTAELPKPLCPVGGRPLLDLAIDRFAVLSPRTLVDVVVNAHFGAEAISAHLHAVDSPPGAVVAHCAGSDRLRTWLSWEREQALGTAGAIGRLRPWLDGRGVLVVNADAWTDAPLHDLMDGWDGVSPRVLIVDDRFSASARVAGALVPWDEVRRLEPVPSGLYETVWAAHQRLGSLQVVSRRSTFVDCGTAHDYLRANLAATHGRSSVGKGARIDGAITRCVVWPGAAVERGERLVDAVRTTAGQTVLVRSRSDA
jgi:NDP-sugar pyrophosphorylase family protein